MEPTKLKKIQQNLLCSAFEGGSNYWYTITKFTKPTELLIRAYPDEIFRHLDYPMNPGGSLTITADDEPKEYTLNILAMDSGWEVMKEKYARHYADAVEENDDATTGDVYLQCCLFGETIYG